MLNVIEGFVKRRFKTWKEYEKVAGIPARHGKRRVSLYVERLQKVLKPLGLKIKIEEE